MNQASDPKFNLLSRAQMIDENPYRPTVCEATPKLENESSRKQTKISGKAVVIAFLVWVALALTLLWFVSPFAWLL